MIARANLLRGVAEIGCDAAPVLPWMGAPRRRPRIELVCASTAIAAPTEERSGKAGRSAEGHEDRCRSPGRRVDLCWRPASALQGRWQHVGPKKVRSGPERLNSPRPTDAARFPECKVRDAMSGMQCRGYNVRASSHPRKATRSQATSQPPRGIGVRQQPTPPRRRIGPPLRR